MLFHFFQNGFITTESQSKRNKEMLKFVFLDNLKKFKIQKANFRISTAFKPLCCDAYRNSYFEYSQTFYQSYIIFPLITHLH